MHEVCQPSMAVDEGGATCPSCSAQDVMDVRLIYNAALVLTAPSELLYEDCCSSRCQASILLHLILRCLAELGRRVEAAEQHQASRSYNRYTDAIDL